MLKVCAMLLTLSLVNRGKCTSVSYQRCLEPLYFSLHLSYNLGQKVLRILLFLTHRRPTLRIWHHGDPSPHPSLVNVV